MAESTPSKSPRPQDPVGEIAFVGSLLFAVGLPLSLLWPALTPARHATASDTGWRTVCARWEDVQSFQALPSAVGMAMGGIDLGGGLAIRSVTTPVCRSHTWECALGRQCDPAFRPGSSTETVHAPG